MSTASAKLVSIKPEGDSRLCTFEAPASETRYLVEKGSVTIDGVSLTVFGVRDRRFSCELIPHTLKMTTLGAKRARRSGQYRKRHAWQIRRAIRIRNSVAQTAPRAWAGDSRDRVERSRS